MNDLPQYYENGETGISYTLVGEHYLPDFVLLDVEEYTIGRFGRERLDYLKSHHKLMYLNLLTSGKLNSHLHEIDETANDRIVLLTKQVAKYEDVTEKLKADDMLLWVKKMNNIRNRVVEIIRDELIYN